MNPARPRIAYFAEHYLPESGALPARVSEMAREWIDAGAEVTVICAMPHRPEGRIRERYRRRLFDDSTEDGIRVLRSWVWTTPSHSFANTILNNLSHAAFSAIQALFSKIDPDVIIASEPPFMPHITGTMLGGWLGVPVVLEVRDLWPDYLAEMGIVPPPIVAALLATERSLLRQAAHVVTVTESFKRRVIAKGVASSNASVISNGIDPSFYRRIESPRVHPALERRGNERIVGYLGNFGRGQGLEQVVGAVQILAAQRDDIRFVMLGGGPTRAVISQMVAGSGGRVIVGSPIPKGETADFYNACDVVLVPHAPLAVFTETVPSKLFEVMACERPFVASVAGEAARIVEQSGGGRVALPGNAGSLASAITAELELSPSESRERGRASRAFVIREFSRPALAQKYLSILRSVAKS